MSIVKARVLRASPNVFDNRAATVCPETPMTAALTRPEKRSSRSRPKAKSAAASAVPGNVILSRGENVLDPARCHQMIAEAAYFYAQQRGFEPGHELDDWLAAEDQIDAALTLDELRRIYGDC
jgi:hypothetical protein